MVQVRRRLGKLFDKGHNTKNKERKTKPRKNIEGTEATLKAREGCP